MASKHVSSLQMFAPTPEKSVFKNFVDLRGSPKDADELVADIASRLPEGQRVTLVLTKADFGRISVPLDVSAAEVVS
jgi:hypothetical protein